MSKAEPQRPLKILKDAVVPGQHGVVPPLHTVCVNRVGCPKWTALPRWGPECLWGRGCLALPAPALSWPRASLAPEIPLGTGCLAAGHAWGPPGGEDMGMGSSASISWELCSRLSSRPLP